MGDANSTAESDGSRVLVPEEVFALLGNDARVGILQVLWDAFESGNGGNALSYFDLFARVAYDETGG